MLLLCAGQAGESFRWLLLMGNYSSSKESGFYFFIWFINMILEIKMSVSSYYQHSVLKTNTIDKKRNQFYQGKTNNEKAILLKFYYFDFSHFAINDRVQPNNKQIKAVIQVKGFNCSNIGLQLPNINRPYVNLLKTFNELFIQRKKQEIKVIRTMSIFIIFQIGNVYTLFSITVLIFVLCPFYNKIFYNQLQQLLRKWLQFFFIVYGQLNRFPLNFIRSLFTQNNSKLFLSGLISDKKQQYNNQIIKQFVEEPMHSSSVQANRIYDELKAYKLVPSRISDPDLQIALDNLETIPQQSVRMKMQYILQTEQRYRKLDRSINQRVDNLLTISDTTNKNLRKCQNKSQNHEQYFLREQSCYQKCIEWTLIICGLLFTIIKIIDLIRDDIASGTEKKIYSWVGLAFGIIIFLIGFFKRCCCAKRYKAKDYQSVSQG